ncbi:hypothetical protein ELS19_17145 [Halogeometricum borinquense]|uniref:Uncharacterized protein n=1 Tax=Halogeometricum borinquense TaxID=60847 RepID=A0A482SYZ5_9EURY|nr:hypothetical protein [Halogeometricum borinquense]RYJ08281.1 hypothetical protein ELS19_17145 [Halogeometricum borinquense]
MTLKDHIQSELVVDEESILEANLERVKPLFDLFNDGTINIAEEYRSLSPENRILIYLIGQRYAFEGELIEDDSIGTQFFYERIDRSDRSIRDYLQNLREDGLLAKPSQGTHQLVAENLPSALERIEDDAE